MRKYRLLVYAGNAHLANIMIGVVFSFLCAHLMNPNVFGDLRYVMAWLPIFMVFGLPGYDAVILRGINYGYYIPLGRVLAVRFGGGIVGSIILTVVLVVFFPNISSEARFFFLCVALILPFFETATGYKNYLIATHLKSQGLRLLTRNRFLSLLMLVSGGYVIYAVKFDPVWLLPMYFIALIAPTLITYIDIAQRQRRQIRPSYYKGLHIRTAISVSLSGLLSTATFSLDKLMLHYYLGATVLAFYSILVMFPFEVARMIDAVYPIYYQRLFLQKKKVNWASTRFMLGFGAIVIVFYAVLFTALSPFVFGVFYKYDFYLVVLASLLIPSGALEYYTLQKIFALYGEKLLLVYSALSVFISYTMYFFVLPEGGIRGILYMLVLRQFLQSILFLNVKWSLKK